MIDAKDCDLFDVLQYISYANKPITRLERASRAEDNIYSFLKDKQQREFIDFVLSNYVKNGIDELDDRNLGTIITNKYRSITDAEQELGNTDEIRDVFIKFQEHLYLENVS